jgi:RNA polymerase sigma factor (TIGR02999 family)
MPDVTQILSQIEQGDSHAAEKLLPLIYDELRKLAAAKLAQEKPGQTLQATALVHEAYLRLVGGQESGVGGQESRNWDSRGHFFAAAAEAMRRILVEQARRKGRHKRGHGLKRVDLDQLDLPTGVPEDDILAIDEALANLEAEDPLAARLVKLRFFAGLSLTQAAAAVGISRTTAYEQWAYARAWLRCAVEGDAPASPE